MKTFLALSVMASIILTACATAPPPPPQPPALMESVPTPAPVASPPDAPASLVVPVEYYKLDNGLRLILSPDHTAPTVAIAVYYNIGFRVEPHDRAGFAHLFEHLMFQGSANLGKREFVKLVRSNGGVLDSFTCFDFTNYYEIVPAHTLEIVLWAEADRMRGLAITAESLKSQQEVVKKEVRGKALHGPCVDFPWLDMPQYANRNWNNARDFYGDLSHLDAATLEDAHSFFKTYYAPNNAALAITGDFDSAEVLTLVQTYFGDIAAQPQPPEADISEPPRTEEKRASMIDEKATRPQLAFAWHTPPQDTPEYYAMGLIEQILSAGDDSWLHKEVVERRASTAQVSSSMDALGNMFNSNGPSLYVAWFVHSNDVDLGLVDEQIARLQSVEVDAATLARARVKMRAKLYGQLESNFGCGKAGLLASFALFYDDPQRINTIESRFESVTPALIRKTAQEYLRRTNRTVLTVVPKG